MPEQQPTKSKSEHMKKGLQVITLGLCLVMLPIQKVEAQIPIAEIIKQAVTKVIKAIDLKVQRLQNKTIWLQNAQKELENKMAKLKLTEISDWVEKQRKLYDDYFQELWQVKTAIANYRQVKSIVERQMQMVAEYKGAWTLFRQDKNFTPDEIGCMYRIYAGLFGESLKCIDQLALVVNSFFTQMSDAGRLEIIHRVSDEIDMQLADLRSFNNQNKLLSIQRSAERSDMDYVKRLYGLK